MGRVSSLCCAPYERKYKRNSKSSVAVLVQPADCDSAIVSLIIENRQRDSAMLLYFLVPWILVTLLLASPLPDMLRARDIGV